MIVEVIHEPAQCLSLACHLPVNADVVINRSNALFDEWTWCGC